MLVNNELAPSGSCWTPVQLPEILNPPQEPIVSVKNLVKRFGALQVLNGVSLEIKRGQLVAIVGRSGSGKSTLLRCMNALESIEGGELQVCGHDVGTPSRLARRELRSDVGIVFQSYNLFPPLSVLENVTLAPVKVLKLSRAQAEARGIAVHAGRQAVRITPVGRELSVHCADGGELAADLVVIAAGTRPRDELAAACGLRRGLRGGVVVDAAMRTSDPRVLAIGECAVRDGEVYAHPEAVQAMAAAAVDTLAGRPGGFAPGVAPRRLLAPGLDALSVGAVHASELDRRVPWQSDQARRVLVLRGGHLVGACGVGPWPEAERVVAAVGSGATLWPWQIAQFRRAGSLWPALPTARVVAQRVAAMPG